MENSMLSFLYYWEKTDFFSTSSIFKALSFCLMLMGQEEGAFFLVISQRLFKSSTFSLNFVLAA